jgi:HEAT repeat protein
MNNKDYPFYDEEDELRREKPDLDTTLKAMQAGKGGGSLNSTIFYGLSSLSDDELVRLRPAWGSLSPAYRRKVMRRASEVAETNFDLDYAAFGRFGLDDTDPDVREAAIDVLWEDEGLDLMERLIRLAQNDESRAVRAAATSALGRFILAGELGDLPDSETERAQDVVVDILNDEDEDVDVRRRALEAIANCGHEIVEDAIEEAYEGFDRRMQVSSIYAMGRTCDAPRWGEIVVRELGSEDPEMRFEATRAAGELELKDAIPTLAQIARDPDSEIKEMAIWSLGEIGGEDAVRLLKKFARDAEQSGDDELVEAIQEAIANAALGGDGLMIL